MWQLPYDGRNLELFRTVGVVAVPLRQHDLGWPRGTRLTVRLQAVGSTLRVFADGALLFTVEDSGIPGPGALGVRHRGEAPASTNQFLSLRWGTP